VHAHELDLWLRELERACFDGLGGRLELSQQRSDVDPTVRRGVGRESPTRFLQLPFAADSVAATRLVPGDGDVYETLEEVTLGRLGRLGRAPRVFQLLMSGEELAGSNQLQAALERVSQGPRLRRRLEVVPALPGRPSNNRGRSLRRRVFPRGIVRSRP